MVAYSLSNPSGTLADMPCSLVHPLAGPNETRLTSSCIHPPGTTFLANSQLEKLDRHPELQALYTSQFFPAVKAAYGSTEAFLMKRLNWDAETVQTARGTGQHFNRNISEDYVRVARNDWAYGVPREYEYAPADAFLFWFQG